MSISSGLPVGAHPDDAQVASVRRRPLRWRWAGLAGALAGAATPAEARAYRPIEERRVATLQRRRIGDYLPRVLTPAPGVRIVALAGLFAALLTALLRGAGRLQLVCADGRSLSVGGMNLSTLGWWVGGSLSVIVAAVFAVRAAAVRGRPEVAWMAAREDDALRRASVNGALGVAATAIALTGATATLVLADALS